MVHLDAELHLLFLVDHHRHIALFVQEAVRPQNHSFGGARHERSRSQVSSERVAERDWKPFGI